MQLTPEVRKKLAQMSRRRIMSEISGHHSHMPAKHHQSIANKKILVRKLEMGRDVPHSQIKMTREVLEATYNAPSSEVERELGRTQNLIFQNEVLEYMKSLENQGIYLFNFSLKIPSFNDQTFVYWANRLVYNSENSDLFNRNLSSFLVDRYSPFVLPEETGEILSTYANMDSSELQKVLGFFEQGDWDKFRFARGTIDQLVGAGNEVTSIYEIGKDRR